MWLDHISSLPDGSDTWTSLSTDFVCNKVKSTLDLEWETNWTLLFQWKKKWWWVDHTIKVHYEILVKSRWSWHDTSSIDDIEISNVWFEWNYGESVLWVSEEIDLRAELYLEKMGINIYDEIRKAYYWED